jgi:hypothetical protein
LEKKEKRSEEARKEDMYVMVEEREKRDRERERKPKQLWTSE